jgi:hypothetical protein
LGETIMTKPTCTHTENDTGEYPGSLAPSNECLQHISMLKCSILAALDVLKPLSMATDGYLRERICTATNRLNAALRRKQSAHGDKFEPSQTAGSMSALEDAKLSYEGAREDERALLHVLTSVILGRSGVNSAAWFVCANYRDEVARLDKDARDLLGAFAARHGAPPKRKTWQAWFAASGTAAKDE